MAPSRERSRSDRRSNDTASVPPSRREARVRLRQGWLQSVVVSASVSIAGEQELRRGALVGRRTALIMLRLRRQNESRSLGKSIFCCSALARSAELSKV